MGMTTFSGPVRSLAGFITGADSFPAVAALPKALTSADSGKTQVIGVATGVVTLPAATSDVIGAIYNFAFSVNAAAGLKIGTATYLSAPGDKFVGQVSSGSGGGSPTIFIPNGTTNDVINLGGTAGGAIGSTLSIQCTGVGVWTVSGNLLAVAGPTVTPFADA